MKSTRYRNTANPEAARIARELARSGAAGTHLDKRQKRKRTRQAKRSAALLDYRR